MWPSASESRGKKKDDVNIAWMSKTKEQRERELSAEMDEDNNDGEYDSFENHFVQQRKPIKNDHDDFRK